MDSDLNYVEHWDLIEVLVITFFLVEQGFYIEQQKKR